MTSLRLPTLALATCLGFGLFSFTGPVQAGPLLDRIKQHLVERREAMGKGASEEALENPDGITISDSRLKVLRDVPYGNDPKQKMDVYLPDNPAGGPAPVIFMVHGGGWRTGDKRHSNVVDNKAGRWVPKGFVLVSVNNRLLPEADPLDQVRDVARALANAQSRAPAWGADPKQFVLMGHSAGAHLIALLSSSSNYGPQAGAQPWLGSVLLDSAALDIAPIMQERHFKLYDAAFGTDPEFWKAASPLQQLHAAAKPMLAVCSTRREDSCAQAKAFSAHATTLGVRVQVSGHDLSHGDINKELGLASSYTEGVEVFMGTLSPQIAQRLR
ncbi:alpha/beta hydrolase [Rhodoferax mekongensis]|uniref:Alpha/beta hydrolase n=1 Tax=Rhodoferax mekongensis TaxID=3068341 RepID=A0ABZ0AVV2_9BURK|nr:alpha/beta hydrolase [Rhodoferax sp. TBRC 17307]WNO03655.1 alpha/beta hydrolase [Rhodoferax sp. TBRC 17307]